MNLKFHILKLSALNNSGDELISKALSYCFEPYEELILLAFKEDSLLYYDDRLELRKRVPEELNKIGTYKIIESIDDSRFSAISKVKLSEYNTNIIRLAYKYYYALIICKTYLQDDKLFGEGNKWFKNDLFGSRKVKSGLFNFCFIKGLDGELFFSFKVSENEYDELISKFSTSFKIEEIKESFSIKDFFMKRIMKCD